MNKRLISLCANIVNQSSIQMDFDNTPMLSKLKVLLLAFTAIENFGSSTKRRFYKSFLMVSMSPPRRSQSLFLLLFSNNAALFSISLIIFFNSKDNAKSLSNFVLKVILAILFPFMITTKWDDL